MPALLPLTSDDRALLLARKALYRFCALTLLDPRAGAWEELTLVTQGELIDEAAAVLRSEPRAQADRLAPGERPLEDLEPRHVAACLPPSRSELNAAYERTFGLLSSCACPLCESEYINGKFTFQRSHAIADVSGFYRAFGLQPSRRHPERHDHVVLQLEFMAFLLDLERGAREVPGNKAVEKAQICRDAQKRFLQEHLAWWAPALCRLLDREDRDGFYAAAGKMLAAFLAAERAILEVTPPSPLAAPGTIERPEECEGCHFG